MLNLLGPLLFILFTSTSSLAFNSCKEGMDELFGIVSQAPKLRPKPLVPRRAQPVHFESYLADSEFEAQRSRIAKLTEWFHKKTGNPMLASYRAAKDKLAAAKNLWLSGATDSIASKYSVIFDRIEAAYLFKQLEKKLLRLCNEALEKRPQDVVSATEWNAYVKRYLIRLKINNVEWDNAIANQDLLTVFKLLMERKVGLEEMIHQRGLDMNKDFYFYYRLRKFLEGVPGTEHVGVWPHHTMGFSKNHRSLYLELSDAERPSIDELWKDFFSAENRAAYLAFERSILAKEIFSVIKVGLYKLFRINRLERFLTKIPFLKDTELVKTITQRFERLEARGNYMEHILQVVEHEGQTEAVFNTLKGLHTQEDLGDGFLATFAATVDQNFNKKWYELLNYAQKEDPAFFRLMEKAAIEGDKLGKISHLQAPSPVFDWVLAISFTGTVSYGAYYYFTKPKNIVESLLPFDENDPLLQLEDNKKLASFESDLQRIGEFIQNNPEDPDVKEVLEKSE